MNEVYLCLGGNLGNCLENLNRACQLINEKAGKLVQCSFIYQSQAWGMDAAPDFYNQVIKIETKFTAQQLISALLDIEKTLGRERIETIGYQNRIMDIDILFFNDEVIKTDLLEIPHPRLHLRQFVLQPLNEIAPNFMHPLLQKTITELLMTCPDKGEVKKLTNAV
ncbi:MAG: 2-amino-4-hydroxy-6-hydroxymethyldihydropteridine diphosphokinase [Bacteroidia bacterium]